jgi:hypothetical protein
MLVELGSLVAFSFLLITGGVGVLLAGAGALLAVRLIGEAVRREEPEDPFVVSLPPVSRRYPPQVAAKFPHQPPLPGIWLGEEPTEQAVSIQECLPF